jgi:hypothetical protein
MRTVAGGTHNKIKADSGRRIPRFCVCGFRVKPMRNVSEIGRPTDSLSGLVETVNLPSAPHFYILVSAI